MPNLIIHLRNKFNRAKQCLQYCDDLDLSETTTANFRISVEKHKAELRNEVRRVSRLVWPLTGRPGKWQK